MKHASCSPPSAGPAEEIWSENLLLLLFLFQTSWIIIQTDKELVLKVHLLAIEFSCADAKMEGVYDIDNRSCGPRCPDVGMYRTQEVGTKCIHVTCRQRMRAHADLAQPRALLLRHHPRQFFSRAQYFVGPGSSNSKMGKFIISTSAIAS